MKMGWIEPTRVGSVWQGFTQVMPGGSYVLYSPLGRRQWNGFGFAQAWRVPEN
jgi:hypothetical protein